MPLLTLDNKQGTVTHSNYIMYVCGAFLLRKEFPVPSDVNAPKLSNEEYEAVAKKILVLEKKDKTHLDDDETKTFYIMMNFVAQLLVSDAEDFLREDFCREFKNTPKYFYAMRKYFLKFSTEVVAALNDSGINE